ncbi:hypothetical protein D3C87_94000 [compost metagenome]
MLKYDREDAILFLVFNRIETTSKVFQAIKEAAPKRLYIAADGPRNAEEFEKCRRVKEIVANVTWDCEIKTLFREDNLGCRAAVSGGINWFFGHEEQGIILEDDCLPSSSFFGFCSVLLEKYKYDNRIGHIGGSNFQNGIERGRGSYYFSRLTHVWGWASWRRVWNNYDVNMGTFPHFAESDLQNLGSHAPFKEIWYKNLKRTFDGEINTWDYQYSYSNIINNYLGVIPNQNFIKNIGFGEGATHTTENHPFANLETKDMDSIVHPDFFIPEVEADLYTQRIEYYQPPIKKKGFLSRTWKQLKDRLSASIVAS